MFICSFFPFHSLFCFQQFFCVFLHENLNRMCFLTHNQRWRQKHSNCLPHATRHFIAHISSFHTPPPHILPQVSPPVCALMFFLSVCVSFPVFDKKKKIKRCRRGLSLDLVQRVSSSTFCGHSASSSFPTRFCVFFVILFSYF